MSLHSLPLVVLNLGGEMFYVFDQRLKAQNVPSERGQTVLNEIAAIMLNKKFLEEIFKPQELYGKYELFLLFREIAHSSFMKLNDSSMGKLFDLMIMVFKYQLYFAAAPHDILLITLNHLDSLRNLITLPQVLSQLDSVYFLLKKTYFTMRAAELQKIRYDLLNYFQDIRIKVSIFLRSGRQNGDGTFVNPPIENIPSNVEIPGIIKLYVGDDDESIRDIESFPPGGTYKKITYHTDCFDIRGNRSIELGFSIYQDKSIVQDSAMFASELNVDSDMPLDSEKSVHRHEINTLVKQLLGNEQTKTHNETILLDLFENNRRKKSEKEAEGVKTVVLQSTIDEQNKILQTAAEMKIDICNDEDLLSLLEKTDSS